VIGMADSTRVRRVAEQVRAELSQILREEVRDPRVGLVTLTRVKLAPDFGAATVFYSPLGEDPDAARREELGRAMEAVAGYARRLLAGRMKLRHTPELRFVLDDSIAEGSRTLSLMRELGLDDDDADRDGDGPDRGERDGDDGETQSEA